MRTLIAALTLALASTHAPSDAAASTVPMGLDHAVAANPLGATGPSIAKKSKKSKKKKDAVTVAFDEIQSVKKGKTDFEIVARVSGQKAKENYTCELTITYADGTQDEADIVELDEDAACIVAIDLPDEGEVVGTATAQMLVRDEEGKKKGSDRTSFKVRAGRAG